MYGHGTVIETEDIYKLISRCEDKLYNVFIQPRDVVSPSEAMETLLLDCRNTDLIIENLLHETFNDVKEAEKRVMMFRGEWLDQFYVACYFNGEFLFENT